MSTLIIKGMETTVFGREGMLKIGIRQGISNSDKGWRVFKWDKMFHSVGK